VGKYDNSLWGDRRKADLIVLDARVPATGEVVFNPANMHLELFRQYSNAYYDIYNNGAGNWDHKGKYLRTVSRFYKHRVGSINDILREINYFGHARELEALGDIVIDAALKEQFGAA
jgi:hypothetical protein